MMNDLLRFNNKKRYIVWDFETEGLNLYDSRPWQLSWIVIEDNQIKETHDKFLLWKDLRISADAARITRFSMDNYLRVAVDPLNIFNMFMEYVNSDYLLVGQNTICYDIYILNCLARNLGKKLDFPKFMNRNIDTLALARGYKTEDKMISTIDNADDLLAWQYRMIENRIKQKCTLTQLCKDFDIEVDENKTHDGLYDIKLNKQVFEKLIWSLDIKDVWTGGKKQYV